MEKRYCQNCGDIYAVFELSVPQKPCWKCGSTTFSSNPKPHANFVRYALTPEDIEFLRVQGIDPEEY